MVPYILGESQDFLQLSEHEVEEAREASENRHETAAIAVEAEHNPESSRKINRKARQSFTSFSTFGDTSGSNRFQNSNNGGFSFQRVRMGQNNLGNEGRPVNFEVRRKDFSVFLTNITLVICF